MFQSKFHCVVDSAESANSQEAVSKVCVPKECPSCGSVELRSAPLGDKFISNEIHQILARSSKRPRRYWILEQTKEIPVREVKSDVDIQVDKLVDWNKIERCQRSSICKCIKETILKHDDPDLCVTVGGTIFKCYSIILQCYSRHFRYSTSGNTVKLQEETVSSNTFRTIYSWMRKSDKGAMCLLTRRNVLSLLVAAEYLGIDALEGQCLAFLQSPAVFSGETALLLSIDDRINCQLYLRDTMFSKIGDSFLKFTRTSRFERLSKESVCTILSSNHVALHVEMEVFMGATRWLLYDWQERKEHFTSVMNCVRFCLMPFWLVSSIRYDQSNPTFYEALKESHISTQLNEALAYTEYRKEFGDSVDDWAKEIGLEMPQERHWISLNDEDECALNNSLWDQFIIEQKEWTVGKGDDRSAIKKRRSKRRPIP